MIKCWLTRLDRRLQRIWWSSKWGEQKLFKTRSLILISLILRKGINKKCKTKLFIMRRLRFLKSRINWEKKCSNNWITKGEFKKLFNKGYQKLLTLNRRRRCMRQWVLFNLTMLLLRRSMMTRNTHYLTSSFKTNLIIVSTSIWVMSKLMNLNSKSFWRRISILLEMSYLWNRKRNTLSLGLLMGWNW